VLEYYETSVRSASAQFLIPAVLRVRMYVSKREFKAGRLSLSRRNIVLRDRGQCQCARAQPVLAPLPGAPVLAPRTSAAQHRAARPRPVRVRAQPSLALCPVPLIWPILSGPTMASG
jgi:hypothetical protein